MLGAKWERDAFCFWIVVDIQLVIGRELREFRRMMKDEKALV